MRWTLKPKPDTKKIADLASKLGVDRAISELLLQRGIENFEDAKTFFRPSWSDLHDPFLMKDMDKAVARIEAAIKSNEQVLVFGDYDVDGTSSVALMASYLETKSTQISTYIPDRYEEGYGVSYKGIDFASDNDFSLIIALDCGVKAIEKVAYAKKKGIDFIICDHHRPGKELPDAVAILDPKRPDCEYPFKELCGCGVGFKLIQALASKEGIPVESLVGYLDLVATAIGADIVPIVGENRALAYFGLQVINTNPRPGFKALINQMKKEVLTITDVVFNIAPRINAAGRMKHGNYAVALMKEMSFENAETAASEIELFNTNRREADKRITQEALLQIEESNETEDATSVVYQEDWHKGVIGIVASRLIETHYRPTLVFTKSGDFLAASARSVRGFDVYHALENCSHLLEQFGGHMYAAGMTIKEENYSAFKAAFEAEVSATLPVHLRTPEIKIDAEIDFDAITPKFYRILKQFAPFGPQNMSPVFMSSEVLDTGYGKCVGEDQTHLRVTLAQKGSSKIVGIGFGMGSDLPIVKSKTPFKVVYSIDENEWNGRVSLQLKLKGIKS
ncbi:recombinase RecJ [Formosa sp. Hel1_33_131]|uniref:single-stranded-DNA-specific exonuclease RecJ n=1 Tax=Formosa sp. Hel1_33_131 TaxID=1336794 RepID=UPI00084E1C0E|nr:single-stranded-DNA-specific exonuclease RecJ [Formosa sp. Hel1_33_131]AOR28129.1 recombinase RecJ [Formosa sp. Hel1_33_131]